MNNLWTRCEQYIKSSSKEVVGAIVPKSDLHTQCAVLQLQKYTIDQVKYSDVCVICVF